MPAQLLSAKLRDETAERVRRSHAFAITELRGRPTVVVVENVDLPEATRVMVAHGQGRPVSVVVGPVRGGVTTTGRIVEDRNFSDRDQFVALTATGWGATVTVDLWLI